MKGIIADMKFGGETLRLYAVTDRAWTGDMTIFEQVECALKGGVTCVQLREKYLCGEDFLEEAVRMKEICSAYGVPLIINDNISVALRSGADGIHVGQSDMGVRKVRESVGGGFIIGASAHTAAQAVEAERAGADYIGAGAVFPTGTKPDAGCISMDELKLITASVKIPVVAIGGINKLNIFALSGSGVSGAALVSAIFSAADIEKECRELYILSEKMIKRGSLENEA